ncbi:YodL domain-containing protein [Acutalibacter intestini]|uniref:YodL domain-containing protein n=1 Tax=Acutalibacter intestini TaxID=3093659 RepID=UPI002AC8B85D|nr:YodL domain-containing protein [Acutalibacter sp. M00204]
MHIKIYQVKSERDPDRAKFMGLSQKKAPVDSSIYDQVFRGDVDCKNLEDVFTMLNTRGRHLYRGHPLSVSDVVLTEDGAYFCDTIGFKEIHFNED